MPYLPVSDEDALARAAALLLGLGFWRAIYPAVVDALFRPWGRHGRQPRVHGAHTLSASPGTRGLGGEINGGTLSRPAGPRLSSECQSRKEDDPTFG
jgi:hypothetical protein